MSNRLSDAAATAQAEAFGAMLLGGSLELFDGDRPEFPDGPGTLRLATCRGLTFMDDPTRPGVVVAGVLAPEVSAPVGGVATWFRLVDASGVVMGDGTVGEDGSEADMILNSTRIVKGARVEITDFFLLVPLEP